ncbi:4-alpha-glucanotransferase [Candidatus Protochlamydia sp. R18]|uniref:4-alpha-glucanotransferase n=1 Tax=Candidatus Protochlamydia sp. R18 TaxID=1353977 RepID=UPI0005A942EB|nr:4-alpha-glucanotransferase [Candidatus Protochlamydia sp. R18]
MIDPTFLLHSLAAKQWERIGIKHHHGINVPLFSVHSSQSCGIGEFTDLFLLIDWCKSINFDLIQLLPLNDSGLGTSPYSALSAFALSPLYLGLHALPHLEEFPSLHDELKAVPKLSNHQRVDYKLVRENKERFLRHYYEQAGSLILNSQAYQAFVQNNAWLKGYAVFKTLKSQYQWSNWESWPIVDQSPTPELLEKVYAEHQSEVDFHCLIQYLCDQQLKSVKAYADRHSVYLMGDIPILIDRDSADVWLYRSLFDLEFSAGAPPDMYSSEGQNWGFPIYNWEALAQENYRWWIDRLNWSCRYYHIYRIDHIIGFFRIWSIRRSLTSRQGEFIPSDEATWVDHGQRIMCVMLKECEMLPIGEDLGAVPDRVRECLSALGICGTRVMRWERLWKDNGRFLLPQEYPEHSMTTVSTHDSETLQQWWQSFPLEAQVFAQLKGWSYHPYLNREYQKEILWDSHHTSSLFHINLLQEYLALIPGLTWPHLEDERINIPGIISERNWSYRFKPSLEELTSHPALTHLMQQLII